uniref:Si:dkey-23f9.4 n=1 Tax=Sphaeramia orbicularis TaxID=375764 RepID=A0A672ZEL9_9TELE
MDSLDFTEEEIQEQLEILGYKNIPKHKLREFKRDLDDLIQRGEWKSLSSSNQVNSQTATSHLSPPAYTKEKLSRHCFRNGDGFFLHAQNGDHDTRVLTTCQNRDYGRQGGCCDSYARHSVASRQQLAPGAPNMLQVELDPEDTTLHPPQTDSFMSTPDSQGRHFIRRKVLRKHNGESLVCDESIYSEDSDAASRLEERLADLHLSPSAQHDSENEDVTSRSDTQSSEAEGMSLTAFESYIRTMTRTRSDGDIRPKPKSFIRPVLSQPIIKKTDPVAKYFQYKQLWEMFKLPGEKDRRDLRWEIRERLAYQPPPPKPRRVFVPNTYTVPTEKKRSALRWEIRNDLANGLLPHKC